jgi:hypothetical protein
MRPPLPTLAHLIILNQTADALLGAHVAAGLALAPDDVRVTRADRGQGHPLPLYTQHLIRAGRQEHMQISNRHMVGCLMSHASVWRQVRGWAFVFEEDVVLSPDTQAVLYQLMEDVRPYNWSILMLQARSFIAEGEWASVGKQAARCANQSLSPCTWYGTRGYIVTEEGARTLLKYVEPVVVQVDALIGLVAAFDPSFLMLWSTVDITGPHISLTSTVWDGCLRCYIPTALNRPLTTLLVAAALVLAMAWPLTTMWRRRRG